MLATGVAMSQKEPTVRPILPLECVRIFFSTYFFFGDDHLRARTHTPMTIVGKVSNAPNAAGTEEFSKLFSVFCSYVHCLQLIFSGAHIECDSADIIDATNNDTLFRCSLLWRRRQQRWRWWEYKLYSLSKCIEMRRCDSETIDKSFAHLLSRQFFIHESFRFFFFSDYFGRKEMALNIFSRRVFFLNIYSFGFIVVVTI